MASGSRRGPGGGNHRRQRAACSDFIAAGLGMIGSRSSEAMEEMTRVIESSDCDRKRTIEKFKSLVESDSEEDWENIGPLHDAASKGQMDTCKHLVEHLGFDVDSVATNGSGLTPLACAVSNGKVIAVRYFIAKGADLNKQDCIGFAPLHYAAKKGHDGIARLLVARGAQVDLFSSGGTPLLVAAAYGKSGVMQILLENNADPNIWANISTLAAVICATPEKVSESACLKCVKLLVKADADINSMNPDTPLVIATSKGLTEVVTYLLEAGADANIPIKHDGSTPIEIAAESGSRSLVDILFPYTSPVQGVSNWSVEGIVAHVRSRPTNDKDKASLEDRKAQLKSLGGKAVAGMDYAGASKFYTEAIELDPADGTLYSNRSLCQLKIGEARDALRDANECTRLRPVWSKGYYRKGAALMSLKEYKEACDAFMDGLKLDPSNMDLQDAYWEAAEAMSKHSAGQSASSLD